MVVKHADRRRQTKKRGRFQPPRPPRKARATYPLIDRTATPEVTWDRMSEVFSQMVREQFWSGVPMPLPGLTMKIEPIHPLRGFVKEVEEQFEADHPRCRDERQVIRSYYNQRLGALVSIIRDEKGRRRAEVLPRSPAECHLDTDLLTLKASTAWSLDAEARAQASLREKIGDQRFRQYLLTGTFIEFSERSGVKYLFRRLRPTLAIRGDRILAALCLHPIGYYEITWAGSMVPTDDVIAHLMLMRGDEAYFWRKANQHTPDDPFAGI